MLAYGTRPEAIKMAPIIEEINRSAHLSPVIVVTGQHREMLDQVNGLFGIVPDHDLDIMRARQTLAEITTRTITAITRVIAAERPDAMVVQGDTTTSFAAALSAFYEQVPVVHVEAGLRTLNRYSPFPEEINRRLTSQVASLHLAPTPGAAQNLYANGVFPHEVIVTGNTVIDALLATVAKRLPYTDGALERLTSSGRRIVLITSHRRESWGDGMRRISAAVVRLASSHADVTFVIPAHLNPVVRDQLLPPLRGLPNVLIIEPLAYGQFARLMSDSYLLLTDSGGVQEEGPSLGKPVLVLRDITERPEAVDAGTARLIGTNDDVIVREVSQLLDDVEQYQQMARAINPYGDGAAAARSVQAIEHMFGLGPRPQPFVQRVAEGALS